MVKKSSANLISILLILVIPVLTLWQISFFFHTMKWDIMDQFFPCRYFISECVNHKIFPLWCPYINFGYPFAADPQSGVFYPFTWIISLVTGYTVYAISTEYIIHIVIAGLSFFFLLRGIGLSKTTSVTFGILYCLSGFFISNAQHLTWIISMAWMPLILLSFKNIFDKPHFTEAIKLAVFLYLGLTGGYPGFFIILFYFFLFYAIARFTILMSARNKSVFKKSFLLFILSTILFFCLSSGYLYSFIESLPHIARGKPITLIEANKFPLSPRAMISFFFPFATTCSTFSMDTDISMANAYCGFLFLPLLFISVFKTRSTSFEKAFFLFAVLCLLAALGKYFVVRAALYKLLPDMNMIRHAGIFRVFTVLGAILFSAKGFEWLINTIRLNKESEFIKKVFSIYFFLLFATGICILALNHFFFPFLPSFRSSAIISFNKNQNLFSHILLQISIQLLLLAFLLIILIAKNIKPQLKIYALCGISIADIFMADQLNIPATVISEVSPSNLQSKINAMPKEFPVPPMIPIDQFTHFSDGSTIPIWYNISFFKKIPAKDGFNSFYLKGVDDFYGSTETNFILKKPIIFFSDSLANFKIEKFNPGEVVVKYQTNNKSQLTLLQSFYKGWNVFLDGHTVPFYQSYNNFISCEAIAGNHEVKFVYNKPIVRILFFISVALLFILIALLIFMHNISLVSS